MLFMRERTEAVQKYLDFQFVKNWDHFAQEQCFFVFLFVFSPFVDEEQKVP